MPNFAHPAFRPAAALVLALSLAALPGCGDALTEENFDAVQVGMRLDEVEHILGKGELQEAGGFGISGAGLLTGSGSPGTEELYLWKSGNREIIVIFERGIVRSKRSNGL